MTWLFKLRGALTSRQRLILELIGIFILLLIWSLLTMGEEPIMHKGILPSPWAVLLAYQELYTDNELIKNIFRSIGLNLAGYAEAIAIALPLGFLTGLFPLFRGMLQRQVDAFRFVPLTAVTGLFIIWFGLGVSMKVHFLAFGILIYLLPVVVQRIDEVNAVYTKTVYTLGATTWQTIRTVYIPAVISRLSDDIRILTAISWTYIIIAETLNNQGGIGSLIWRTGQRQGRVDKLFALLVIIVLIGFIQDKLFVYMDKQFFPYKYQNKNRYQKKKSEVAEVLQMIMSYGLNVLSWILLGIYGLLIINEWTPILSDTMILSHWFGDTLPIIHGYIALIFGYKVYRLVVKNSTSKTRNLKTT